MIEIVKSILWVSYFQPSLLLVLMSGFKQRLLNFLLLISFVFVYLEWGQNSSVFVFEAEFDILFSGSGKWKSFVHPLILAPFLGQVLLLITLFQKYPNRKLSTIGILLMGLLVFFVFAIGFLSKNVKIILFALPYVLLTLTHFLLVGRSVNK